MVWYRLGLERNYSRVFFVQFFPANSRRIMDVNKYARIRDVRLFVRVKLASRSMLTRRAVTKVIKVTYTAEISLKGFSKFFEYQKG